MALPFGSVESYSVHSKASLTLPPQKPTIDNRENLSRGLLETSIISQPPASALTLLRRHQTRRESKERLSLLLHSRKGAALPLLGLGITEIAGPAGCGKTQIGLSVCVSCAMMQRKRQEPTTTTNDDDDDDDENKDRFPDNIIPTAPLSKTAYYYYETALYVSLGEGTTQARVAQRLHQMAAQRGNYGFNNHNNSGEVLKRILTRFIRNEDEFKTFLERDLPRMLLTQSNIGAIVLDSIAGLFRVAQTTTTDYAMRSGVLFQVAAQLKRISEMYQLPIVVINQVTSSLQANRIVPALGVSWANCVNTSYMLSRSEGLQDKQGKQKCTFLRRISLVRSSSLAPFSTCFRIDASGAILAD
jgi:RecA/RadA recombinase